MFCDLHVEYLKCSNIQTLHEHVYCNVSLRHTCTCIKIPTATRDKDIQPASLVVSHKCDYFKI